MGGGKYLEVGIDLIVRELRDPELSHARICKTHTD